ncbi:MAG: exonuclease, partial [Gammaproteobacteria bacterium]|nr:exonuclease [Gammaproteobacteria bacterium]
GWEPEGPSFRRLINHGATIPPEASRVHGYTREILERDGDDPCQVYRELADYLGEMPVCAYNLGYDWDEVLLPEWRRLGIESVGTRGFCLYELTQRLLDPVPAGNCKLQTLCQYYGLPARGAYTALGDVETIVDLLRRVLRPLCEARGLVRFDDLDAFTAEPWFPSRLPFGKYKGRSFREACEDAGLHGWLEWLAASDHPRSRTMGRWYLERLETAEAAGVVTAPASASLVVYVNPDLARLRQLIEQDHSRLAELEADYTALRQAVSITQARLFQALEEDYRQRDLLRLRLDWRRRYLDTLQREGEEEAGRHEQARVEAEERLRDEYARTAREAEGRRVLSPEETAEIKQLWRKLVRLYHPDRYAAEPARREVHERLTAEINRARDAGDIDRLREIAGEPEAFLAGLGSTGAGASEDLEALERLHMSLQGRILELIEAIEAFRQSPDGELHATLSDQPALFTAIVAEYRAGLRREIDTLTAELNAVEDEIRELGV